MFLQPKRPPDQYIGDPASPYMLRWFLIPHNRFFNVYYHKFLRSDDPRAKHDHPWASLSILLEGCYKEHTEKEGILWRQKGDFIYRSAEYTHRIELTSSYPTVSTLFITGPKVREWGFHCPGGWTHWKQFDKYGCGDPHFDNDFDPREFFKNMPASFIRVLNNMK